jgi:hypothetical protein
VTGPVQDGPSAPLTVAAGPGLAAPLQELLAELGAAAVLDA